MRSPCSARSAGWQGWSSSLWVGCFTGFGTATERRPRRPKAPHTGWGPRPSGTRHWRQLRHAMRRSHGLPATQQHCIRSLEDSARARSEHQTVVPRSDMTTRTGVPAGGTRAGEAVRRPSRRESAKRLVSRGHRPKSARSARPPKISLAGVHPAHGYSKRCSLCDGWRVSVPLTYPRSSQGGALHAHRRIRRPARAATRHPCQL